MKKSIVLILMLILLSLSCIPRLKAQEQIQGIIINADGTITPSTAPIQQEADTYYLTGDFQGSIQIQRSNIVFVGVGHSIQGYSVELLDVTNVTVKDLIIRGLPQGSRFGIALINSTGCRVTNNTITDVWSFLGLNGILYAGVYVSGGGSNVFTKNLLVNNSMGMYFVNTTNNLVTENSINYTSHSVNSSTSGISFDNSSDNTIYHNSFQAEFGLQADAYQSNNIWDNGYPDGGNFWIDYHSRYPNATVIGDSGIGNMAYIIDDLNRDNYPLMAPFNASAIVKASPTPSITPVADGKDNSVLIGTVAASVAVLAVVGLVAHFKRRR